jgi:hypothetical protein
MAAENVTPYRDGRLSWARIFGAAVAAEIVPILALVAIVFVYSLIRKPESPSPEQFAPAAGAWVGPIGGFLLTLWFARWAAKGASGRPISHGVAVGVCAAILDFAIALILVGGAAFTGLLFWSNGGRILAGLLGGWLVSRPKAAPLSPPH